MNKENPLIHPADIACIVFDFGFTLSSDLYFKLPPPECPNWQRLIQEHIFSDPELVDDWMRGSVTLPNIAEKLVPIVGMEVPRIVDFMELGCRDLDFNEAVLTFAIEQRALGRKTAIVTGNMDVFMKIVVPSHSLIDKFDVIINSFDYREIDKSVLWPQAFELLGNGMGYGQSLLIEDGEKNVAKFRGHGGRAYRYGNDEDFLAWLKSAGWR
jgi:FMN phosphatase YigB (HAD superfamily)